MYAFARAPVLLTCAALAVGGCADPVDPDAGVPADAEPAGTDAAPAVDAGELPPRDAGDPDTGTPDAGGLDADAPDAAPIDSGPVDSGPRVVPIEVAYSATVQEPLLAELFLTASSTTRVTVTPVLAGGPQTGGKGEDVISGVGEFAWVSSHQLIYTAQQDTYDQYEIYLAEDPGTQRLSKLSVETPGGETRGWSLSPNAEWLTFTQVPAPGETRNQRFAVRVQPGASPVQISVGSSGVPHWSPVNPELAFQDIIVSANDRDLWHVDLSTTPPTRTRTHPGANLGFSGSPAWSPDGTRLAFGADEVALRVFEPYQVIIRSGVPGPAVRLTPAFPANADLVFGASLAYNPQSTQLAYVADSDTDQLEELFVLDPTGALPATPMKVSLPFPSGADGVDRFAWSADGARILYVADHDTADRQDIYLTDATGPTGVRINAPLADGDSVEHERLVRSDSMVVYTRSENNQRRLKVVDVSGAAPSAPVDLGPIHPFFPSARLALSPSEDYMVFEDLEDPPQLHIARLTGTPTVTASFDAWRGDEFVLRTNWCWGPQDELLIVREDGQLYLVEDKDLGDTFLVSGPLAEGGRVTACAFPPR